jgi:diguanylate cyclase (GGDEF)-like protein/PAS domain S-box-containing protein
MPLAALVRQLRSRLAGRPVAAAAGGGTMAPADLALLATGGVFVLLLAAHLDRAGWLTASIGELHGPAPGEAPVLLAVASPAALAVAVRRLLGLRQALAAQWRELTATRESEARFRLMADNAPAIVWLTEADGQGSYVSRRWFDLTGQADGEGEDWQDYLHPEDREAIQALKSGPMVAQRPFEIEFRLRHRDGSWRWMLEAGTPRHAEDGSFLGYVGSMIDIDGHKRAAELLRHSEARFRDVASASSDWLWETDASGRFTYLSDRYAKVLGEGAATRLGRPAAGEDGHADWHELEAAIAARRPFRDFRYRVRAADGQELHLKISGIPVVDDAGRFLGYRGTGTDITSEVKAQAEARFLAYHDPLTGLPNRVLVRERLEQDLARARRTGETVAVLCLDLDRFKEVNDLYGHSTGDALLQAVADRLRANLRASDTAARLGGDEFALLLPGMESAEAAAHVADRLVERLSEPYEGNAFDAFVGTSIGIAIFPTDALDPEDLMRCADMALYRAKTEGRGRSCLFAPEMDERLQARRQLELELKGAIARKDELFLHFQPQFDLQARQLVGFEALVRWRHPQRGFVSPGDFIPLAEETGLIVPLGAWVLRRACRDAVRWPSRLSVSVNLSAAQFKQRDLAEMIATVLEETGLEPGRLELEITETVLLQDTEATLKVLGRLKAMGVRIAMDDFGKGYSSLGYLRRFAFDKIKIDRSFVDELGRRADAGAVVDAALSLGRNLNMTATAEGVETGAQLERLREMGCEQVQGFFCGRPMTAEAVLEALADRSVGCSLGGWVELTAGNGVRGERAPA